MADQDSFASHWRVKGEDWQMFWREGQGWQIGKSLVSQRKSCRMFCGREGQARVADRDRQICESLASQRRSKIGKCSGGRFKGGRVRQFCESLASQRRRLANVLARGPRLTERDSLEVFGMVHHRDRHNPPSQAHLGLFGGEKKSQNKNFDNHNITTI